jgi:hypothetical protein
MLLCCSLHLIGLTTIARLAIKATSTNHNPLPTAYASDAVLKAGMQYRIRHTLSRHTAWAETHLEQADILQIDKGL